jgi:hypothetical protein
MRNSPRLVRAIFVATLAVAGVTAVAAPTLSGTDPGQPQIVARKLLGR